MILIISNKEDITTDFLINKLNNYCIKYFRLNTDEILRSIALNFDFANNKYNIYDKNTDSVINLSDIKSVYFRRPKLPKISGNLSTGEELFVKNEIKFTLEGLYKILDNKFWINNVYRIREAENKIYQLLFARKLGFSIPSSLISTVEKSTRDFIEKNNNNCIIKPIKSGLIQDDKDPKNIFTSLLSKKDIKNLDRVKFCPSYFQKNITKKADIRVTVVGKKIFAAKISSQEYKETSIDWRKGNNIRLDYNKIKLPAVIRNKCIDMTRNLGLTFSAIDLILNKKDEYIFLEINPNGQWAWIENRLGYSISSELINLLQKGNKQ
ncbi:MAG: MvdC/MvdD family ATP grasp protein [Bacillota bacterium]